MTETSLNFAIVTSADARTLFDLLAQRTHAISHHTMPAFADHAVFVENHPYRAWYLVSEGETPIGSFYLTDQNTIGINLAAKTTPARVAAILAKVAADYAPLPAITSVRQAVFAVNVAAGDTLLHEALAANDATLVQSTYLISDQS